MKDEKKDQAGCGTAIVVMLLLLPHSLMRGWLLSMYWAWFIRAVFDVPQIGVLQAIGLSMVATLFMAIPKTDKEADTSTAHVVGVQIGTFLYYFVAIGLGYALHKAMS